MTVCLSEVIPWGRSLDEYRSMLALTDDDLAGTILGCGDGPASFNAEATALGHQVTSCDPIYALRAVEIERRVDECYELVISQVRNNPSGSLYGSTSEIPTISAHAGSPPCGGSWRISSGARQRADTSSRRCQACPLRMGGFL